jgi:hypothetical protein
MWGHYLNRSLRNTVWGFWLDSSWELLHIHKWTLRFIKAENLLTTWTIICFSRRARLHWVSKKTVSWERGGGGLRCLGGGTLRFPKISSHELRQKLVCCYSNILYISHNLILISTCFPFLFLFGSWYVPVTHLPERDKTAHEGNLHTGMPVCRLDIHKLHCVLPEVTDGVSSLQSCHWYPFQLCKASVCL